MADWLPLSIAVLSITLRIVGVAYSGVLLYRVRDLRFGFLTLMLTLMAARQAMTLGVRNPGIEELPGLIVSGLAVLTVYYLSQYVAQERRVKDRLTAKNDQLRGFREAIRHAGHGIFITDTDGVIEYANPAVEALTGYDREAVVGEDPSMWKSGEHDEDFYASMWETVLSGDVWEGEIVNERKDGDHCWVDMTIAPITDSDGDIERFVAVDTDVTERKERERRIEEQNEQLQRLNTTNRILRDVNQALVQAESRGEIEQAVCAEFADTTPYSFAWVGTRNMVNEALRASTHAGIDQDDLAAVVDAHNDSTDEDVLRRAIRTRSPQVVTDLGADPGARWESVLADRGYRSVAAVPLVHDDMVYGAVEIVSSDPDAFDELDESVRTDRALPDSSGGSEGLLADLSNDSDGLLVDPSDGSDGVLGELGHTVAYAINATESKQALLADSVVELEFALDGGCGVCALARELNADATLERLTQSSGGHLIAYATLTNCGESEVDRAIERVAAVADAAFVCPHDDGGLFRLRLAEPCIEATFVDHGGVVTSQSVDDGEARLTVEFPQRTDVRSLLESVSAAHDGVDLVARREHERPARTQQEVQAVLEESLTDRQLEALRTAYVGGFFQWPRENTGEEVAELMGISQTTFLQHLRTAQQKTLEIVLGSSRSDEKPASLP